MENHRPHRRTTQQLTNSLKLPRPGTWFNSPRPRHSMKRQACDNYYSDVPISPNVKRHRSHDEHNPRRASLGTHSATNYLPPRYEEQLTTRSVVPSASCTETRRSKHSRNQVVAPSNTPSTSFSFDGHVKPQPFYHTMNPDDEYVAMERKTDVRCRGKPPPAPNSSRQSFSSSTFCETSLVSSSMIYDPVFTPNPKLPRTSTLKSQHVGSAHSNLRQQPSVSTIASNPSMGMRPKTEGESMRQSNDSLSKQSVHHCKQGHTMETHRGKLKLAIYHNQKDMLVHVVSVKNLQRKTKKKSITEVFVYVKVAVVTSRSQVLYSQSTRPTRSTKMTQIHEVFTFDPHWQVTSDCRLLISVFKRTTRNELAGCMSFGFNSLFETKKNINGWYYLLDEVLGQSKHLAVKSKSDDSPQCMDRPNTILPWITLQRVTLKRSPDGKYGFTVLDTMPVQVGSVEKGSTAASSGLRKGDAFLELAGANVAGIQSRSLAQILKKADSDIQALIQRTGDRSQRPLPAPPLQTHTAPARIKHKDVKAIAKAKAKASTLKRPGGHSPRDFRDRPRSLPLIEQRLKRELTAKLAARKARAHLQNSRKRKQQDMKLEAKKEVPFFTKQQNDEEDIYANSQEEDVYANSQVEGYYLVPMSREGSEDEDSQPEAEYATIHHSNRTSTALVTPGMMSATPPPPPPPPPQQLPAQQQLQQPPIQQQLQPQLQQPTQQPLQEQSTQPPMINNDIYVQTPNNLPLFADESLILPNLSSIEEAPALPTDKFRPKLIKSASVNSETIYENDNDIRLSTCKFAADDFGHVYENLDEKVKNELDLQDDEIPDDIPVFVEPVVEPVLERIVEGASSSDISKDRSSVSMHSVGSSVESASEHNTPPSSNSTNSGNDESMSVEEMEVTCENVVSDNVVWAKGVKPFRLDQPGRNLVHVGRLFVKTKKKKLREMLVILFSDVLVFCKPLSDGKLKVLYRPLQINDISILDFNRKIAREFSIKLVAGAERHPVACMCNSLILRAPTAKLKIIWKKLLQQRLMIVKCNSDTLKGLDGRRPVSSDIRPCTMDSKGDTNGVTTESTATTVLQNKIVQQQQQPGANVSEKLPTKEEVKSCDTSCDKAGNTESQCSSSGNVAERTNCEGGKGCVAKPIKKTRSAPMMEENRIKKMASREEKSSKVPDREVEYENMDIVRKLRAALNTSNSNHNNRKILDYSSSSTSAQSSPALQHNPIERITMSAPSSPAMKAPLQSLQRRLLHRHSSPSRSPTKESNSDSSTKPRRRGLFKRLSGGNRTEVVTAKGSRTLSLEEREAQKKKSIEAQQKARRTLSMGDDHLLRTSPVDQPNSIDAVKEEDEETAGELVATTENNSVNDQRQPPRKSRNIARDLKDKMRFLRRRHTDSSLRDSEKCAIDKSLVPDSEAHARKWAESFEQLLRDQRGLEAFRRFLQTEFSDENIEFWLACEEYKTLKSNKLGLRARKIYDDYVTIQAPREVNLDSRTRLETADLVEAPDEHTFDGAQKRIEALMEKDSYPRFMRSEMYHKLLKESKKK